MNGWVTYSTDRKKFLELVGSDPTTIDIEVLVGGDWTTAKSPHEEVLRRTPMGSLRVKRSEDRYKIIRTSNGLSLVLKGPAVCNCTVSTQMSEAAIAEMIRGGKWSELSPHWLTAAQIQWRLNGAPVSVSLQAVASEATRCG